MTTLLLTCSLTHLLTYPALAVDAPVPAKGVQVNGTTGVLMTPPNFFQTNVLGIIYALTNAGFTTGTGGGTSDFFSLTNQPVVSNTVYAAKSGTNATGLKDRPDKPFLTLAAAQSAAVRSALINVAPGSYAGSLTTNHGEHWLFAPGASVSNATAAILLNAATNSFTVSGAGSFTNGSAGVLLISNSASVVSLSAQSIHSIGPGASGTLDIRAGRLFVDVDSISGTVANGINWSGGESFVKASVINGFYGIWGEGAGAGSLYVDVDFVVAADSAIVAPDTAPEDAKLWVNAKLIEGTSFAAQIQGGRNYITAQKLSAAAVVAVTRGTLWLQAEKLSGVNEFITVTGGRLIARVDDWEDRGISSAGISINGGAAEISGGKMTLTNASCVRMGAGGGLLRLSDIVLDTSANTNTSPIIIDELDGEPPREITLKNVTLIAGGTNYCINAAAAVTIYIEGSLSTTNPVDPLVTLIWRNKVGGQLYGNLVTVSNLTGHGNGIFNATNLAKIIMRNSSFAVSRSDGISPLSIALNGGVTLVDSFHAYESSDLANPTLSFSGSLLSLGTGSTINLNGAAGTVSATSFAGSGAALTLDASGFNGNLTTSDNTLQEVAQKVDDLSVGGSGTGMQTNQFTTNVIGQPIIGEVRYSSISAWTNGTAGVGITNNANGSATMSGPLTNASQKTTGIARLAGIYSYPYNSGGLTIWNSESAADTLAFTSRKLNISGVSFNSPAGYQFNFSQYGGSGDGDAGNSGNVDLGFTRKSAGVFELNSGTAGIYRDLLARSGTFTNTAAATNGFILQVKGPFSTNSIIAATNDVLLVVGTNQLLTLPDCTNTATLVGKVFRFSSTNVFGSFILTNANGFQTLGNGFSFSYTNVGDGSVEIVNSGRGWWFLSDRTNPVAGGSGTTFPLTASSTVVYTNALSATESTFAVGTNLLSANYTALTWQLGSTYDSFYQTPAGLEYVGGSPLIVNGTFYVASGGASVTGDVAVNGQVTANSFNGNVSASSLTSGTSATNIAFVDTTFTGSFTIDFGTTMPADDTSRSIVRSGRNNSGGVTQWDAVYLNSSSQWVKADANGSGTYPCRGIATTTESTGDPITIISRGTIRNDAWTWTPGGSIYLSTTPGGLTQTPPSTTGDKVQVIGYALDADTMAVEISPDYGTAP